MRRRPRRVPPARARGSLGDGDCFRDFGDEGPRPSRQLLLAGYALGENVGLEAVDRVLGLHASTSSLGW